MSTLRCRVFAFLVLAATTAASTSTSRAMCLPIDDDRVLDEVLVTLVPHVTFDGVAARHSLTALDAIPEWSLYRARVAAGADVDAVVNDLNADPDVQDAEPHRHFETAEGVQRSIGILDLTANPTAFLGQTAALAIHTDAAHARYTGDGVTIAIVDTAESLAHPMTTASMSGTGFDVLGEGPTVDVPPNGIDDDGDGMTDESDQHGTFIAGMAHLAAPGARILAIRVLDDDGKGDGFAIAKGILRAIREHADVINLSLGMTHDSKPLERAVEEAVAAGIVVVAAAGNRGTACVDFPGFRPEVVTVAGVDDSFAKTSFSSFGTEVDLSAPSGDLLSTWSGGLYARWSGTSFSTPLVAGGIALLVEKYPGLTPAQVLSVVTANTQPDANPPTLAGLMGSGVLDLDRLTAALTSDRTSLKIRGSETGSKVVRWSPVLGAGSYDLARGSIENLRQKGSSVDLGPMQCLANDRTATDDSVSPDAAVPAPGKAFFYVFRDDAPDAPGATYGDDGQGHARIGGLGDCPTP